MPTPLSVEYLAKLARQAIQAECLVAKADGAYLKEDAAERIIVAAINTALSAKPLIATP